MVKELLEETNAILPLSFLTINITTIQSTFRETRSSWMASPNICETRLQSSRMCTARLLPISPSMHCTWGLLPGGCLLLGGVCSWGFLPVVRGGGVCSREEMSAQGGCLPMVPGGVCSWGGCLSLVPGGVSSHRGCLLLGGCLPLVPGVSASGGACLWSWGGVCSRGCVLQHAMERTPAL